MIFGKMNGILEISLQSAAHKAVQPVIFAFMLHIKTTDFVKAIRITFPSTIIHFRRKDKLRPARAAVPGGH
jgi:hypothetical protein